MFFFFSFIAALPLELKPDVLLICVCAWACNLAIRRAGGTGSGSVNAHRGSGIGAAYRVLYQGRVRLGFCFCFGAFCFSHLGISMYLRLHFEAKMHWAMKTTWQNKTNFTYTHRMWISFSLDVTNSSVFRIPCAVFNFKTMREVFVLIPQLQPSLFFFETIWTFFPYFPRPNSANFFRTKTDESSEEQDKGTI